MTTSIVTGDRLINLNSALGHRAIQHQGTMVADAEHARPPPSPGDRVSAMQAAAMAQARFDGQPG
jgi:hypothetical protein